MNEFEYMPEDVSRATVQVLETLDILGTSKVLNTIVTRFDFLKQTIPTLQGSVGNPRYLFDLRQGIDRYLEMYYDRQPTEEALAIVRSPNSIHLSSLFCDSLVRGIGAYVDGELLEIQSLKRATAVTRRIAKLLETVRLANAQLDKECTSAATYNSGKKALLDLETKLAIGNSSQP